jgi:hypothetical protein
MVALELQTDLMSGLDEESIHVSQYLGLLVQEFGAETDSRTSESLHDETSHFWGLTS